MAERTWPDGNDRERAPEEAAIERWLEDERVYLTVPGSDLPWETKDPRIADSRQPGGAGD